MMTSSTNVPDQRPNLVPALCRQSVRPSQSGHQTLTNFKIASITPEARAAADQAGLTTQKAQLDIAPAAERVQQA
jgi:hypothetical protein